MKETPILFKAEMIRAILENRKTMTRRIIKPQPNHFHKFGDGPLIPQLDDKEIVCKYGGRGDILWVRETWHHSNPSEKTPGYVSYRADGEFTDYYQRQGYKWRPSIFMPRWASRITLEITDVRAERLNDISESDALAEGVDEQEYENRREYINLIDPAGRVGSIARGMYQELWGRINYPESWEENPYVWCAEFKRIAPA